MPVCVRSIGCNTLFRYFLGGRIARGRPFGPVDVQLNGPPSISTSSPRAAGRGRAAGRSSGKKPFCRRNGSIRRAWSNWPSSRRELFFVQHGLELFRRQPGQLEEDDEVVVLAVFLGGLRFVLEDLQEAGALIGFQPHGVVDHRDHEFELGAVAEGPASRRSFSYTSADSGPIAFFTVFRKIDESSNGPCWNVCWSGWSSCRTPPPCSGRSGSCGISSASPRRGP